MDKTFSAEFDLEAYASIRDGGAPWFVRERKGILAVSGGEAVQFLNGLITNDIASLEDGGSMIAAFPNAKGRMLALVSVEREDERFVFTTEEATYESLLANLQRFTFAGDFHLEDLTETREVITVRGTGAAGLIGSLIGTPPASGSVSRSHFGGSEVVAAPALRGNGFDVRIAADAADSLAASLTDAGAVKAEGPLADVLRTEAGIPIYGKDMDEETVVPEVALEGLISYQKGCYIGQEVIARIHFRGKVAKELKGVVFEAPEALVEPGDELVSPDGKNAGVITSKAYSPKLKRHIAMAYIRNAYLEPGTELRLELQTCRVADIPFID